jgi:hypothetical protein
MTTKPGMEIHSPFRDQLLIFITPILGRDAKTPLIVSIRSTTVHQLIVLGLLT